MKLIFTLAAAAVLYHLPSNAKSRNEGFEIPSGFTPLTSSRCLFSSVNNLPLQYFASAKPNDVTLTKTSIYPSWLLNFSAAKVQNKVQLKWTIAENEIGLQFEIQKSVEGINFTTVNVIPATKRTGIEAYRFTEKYSLLKNGYYRLKLVNRDGSTANSNTILLNSRGNVLQHL